MTDTDKQTKFEQDLKDYFPEIYKLHIYGKMDAKIWKVAYQMIDFFERRVFGRIEITYQNGKINHIAKIERIESDD